MKKSFHIYQIILLNLIFLSFGNYVKKKNSELNKIEINLIK